MFKQDVRAIYQSRQLLLWCLVDCRFPGQLPTAMRQLPTAQTYPGVVSATMTQGWLATTGNVLLLVFIEG